MGLVSVGSTPTFPTRLQVRDYGFLVNHIKIHVSKKDSFFDIFITSKMKRFLILLLDLGVIRRFIYLKPNFIRIFPNWAGRGGSIKKIRFYQKKTPLRLTKKALKILEIYWSNSNIILDTPYGLLTHHQAISRSTGGHLVCFII